MESGAKCGENSPECSVNVGRYLHRSAWRFIYVAKHLIIFFFAEPNDESGANVDAAIMWREQREEFNKIAKRIVRKSLGLPS